MACEIAVPAGTPDAEGQLLARIAAASSATLVFYIRSEVAAQDLLPELEEAAPGTDLSRLAAELAGPEVPWAPFLFLFF